MKKTIRVCVHYPCTPSQKIVIRCDQDWETNIESIESNQNQHVFRLPSQTIFWKACLKEGDALHWAQSANQIAMSNDANIWPCFYERTGNISPKKNLRHEETKQRGNHFRVYTPPGYQENSLKKYPVLYMHDGGNLFFAKEAFMGIEWQADETMDRLHSMNIIDKVIIVAVYPQNRFTEYTMYWDVHNYIYLSAIAPLGA